MPRVPHPMVNRAAALIAGALAITAAGCGDGAAPPKVPEGRLVFATTSGFTSGLVLSRSDGSQAAPLLVFGEGRPAWSPDGSQIAFQRPSSMGYTHIWVMSVSDRQLRQVTNPVGFNAEHDVTWSPAGDRLAFATTFYSEGYGYSDSVVIANADGSGAHVVAAGTEPAWGPDGRIAYVDRTTTGSMLPAIWVIGQDGVRRQLSPATTDPIVESEPAWSSDGRLAWTRRRIGTPSSDRRDEWSIMVQPTPSAAAVPVLTGLVGMRAPAWSPDGTHLAITADWSGTSQVWIMTAARRSRRQVTAVHGCGEFICANYDASWTR